VTGGAEKWLLDLFASCRSSPTARCYQFILPKLYHLFGKMKKTGNFTGGFSQMKGLLVDSFSKRQDCE
jgi:hypothetical protein